jgi:pilus assembly protein CpaE
MPNDNIQPEHDIHAVFSICATPDVAKAATEACVEVGGSDFFGEFHDYFSPDRHPQLPPALKAASVCIAVVDCDRDPEAALGTMDRLRTMGLKNLNIVAYSTQMEANYLLRAMRAGCNEFLGKPATGKALQEALQRFQAAHLVGSASKDNIGKLLTFFGAKGGVGTTTLAVHLANNLVRRHRKRTLLIDHQHELGHVGLYLGMKESHYHFDELVRNASRLDTALLNGFVVRHASGLEVLASPDSCAGDHKSSPEELQLVLNFLRTQYDYVVVDSSINYKNIVAPLWQCSDDVYLVATPDLAALRDLARHIEHLNLEEGTVEKLKIIINRSTSDDAVSGEQIATVVRHPVWMAIPNAYADLVKAINAGEPISIQHNSGFAKQMGKWAEKLVATGDTRTVQPNATKKGFSFWRSRREQMA